MKIQDKELVKVIKYLYEIYFNDANIIIHSLDCLIEDSIKLTAIINYCNMDCEVRLLTHVDVNDNHIILMPKGIVKYGFIQLDLMKVLIDFTNKYDFIFIKNQKVYINNTFVSKVKYSNREIELSLK